MYNNPLHRPGGREQSFGPDPTTGVEGRTVQKSLRNLLLIEIRFFFFFTASPPKKICDDVSRVMCVTHHH